KYSFELVTLLTYYCKSIKNLLCIHSKFLFLTPFYHMENILLKKYQTQYNTAPFSKINNSDFLPAIKKAIEHAKIEIDAIATTAEHPTFENTIEALEFSGEQLDRIASIFFNLNSAETNDEIQKIAQEVSPLLSEF